MATKAKQESEDTRRRLEAIAAAIGGIIAVATLGTILWFGLSGSDKPPSISVNEEKVRAVDNGYVVELSALNSGDQPAAQVLVTGRLVQEGATVETSQTTFDYLPSGSVRRGGLFFSHDPRTGEMLLRAEGYVNP